MTTKYLDGVQVTEGRTDNAPRLIGTYNYSDFTTPSATKYKALLGVLSRNAKERTFLFNTTLNQPLTSAPLAYFYDSTIGLTNSFLNGTNIGGTLVSGSTCVDTSEKTPLLCAHLDSIYFGMAMGATLPTSGKVDIYVLETF